MARQQNNNGSNMPREAPKPASLDYPQIAADYDIDKPLWNGLRNLYPGAQDQSIVMVYEYCKVRKLDPLKKPVHIVPMSVKDVVADKYVMRDVIMPGIQEMRTTAARTGAYAGMDEVVFGPDTEFPMIKGEVSESPVKIIAPAYAKVTVYRLVQGKRYPFTHVEYFAEAVARDRYGKINEMWTKRPSGQLAKVAEAGALRKAFPEELGGEYAADEMLGREEFDDAAAVVAATAIPGPDEIPAPDALPAPEATKPAPAAAAAADDDATGLVDPAEAKAAEERMAAREAKKAEPPAPKSNLKIDLPGGALSVLNAQMQNRGITADQLLAKMGEDVVTSNINKALGLIKVWED